MRYVLLYSFGHAFMHQLALKAGYSAANLKESTHLCARSAHATGHLVGDSFIQLPLNATDTIVQQKKCCCKFPRSDATSLYCHVVTCVPVRLHERMNKCPYCQANEKQVKVCKIHGEASMFSVLPNLICIRDIQFQNDERGITTAIAYTVAKITRDSFAISANI